MTGKPVAEVRIDAALVKSLLRDQFPQYAEQRLKPVGGGWDNEMMRLGADLLVRLPRRAVAAPLLEHEQRWLPELAPRLPIAVPAPIHAGRPGRRYPWPWSILPWLPGETADLAAPRPDQGLRLAEFLAALHRPAPSQAPINPLRGVALSIRADSVAEQMERVGEKTDLIAPRIREVWREALDAPPGAAPCWLHGDLHPLNVLVRKGRITGVIDWGDMTGGDVATDLAAFWMLFDGPARRQALAAYGDIDRATLVRARGWAVFFGVGLLDIGLGDYPRYAAVGMQILRQVLAGP